MRALARLPREKSNFMRAIKEEGRVALLFLLNRFQILDQILQVDIAQILVFFDLMENRDPDGHFT